MAAITKTDIDNALKRYYHGQQLSNVVFGSEDRPFLNMVKKVETFQGTVTDVPVFYEDAAGGRSATFSDAQAGASAVEIGRFAIDVVENHQVVQITTDALLRGVSDKGSFLRNQILRVDTSLNNLANDIETSLYRDGSGQIGQVSSPGASTTLTLVTADDARNFYVNQDIVFAADNTSALRDSGANLTVTAVDYVNGTLTVNANVSTITGITNNDAIFTEGDYVSASDTLKVTGLDGWLSGTSTLFGQDRSLHSRLQGIAGTGGLSDIKKAITDNASLAKMYASAKPDVALMGWQTFGDLVDQLDVDVRRQAGPNAQAGFSFIEIFGPSGPMKVVGATHCPDDRVYLLQMDTWTLYSMGPAVRINNDDGMMAQRQSSAAGLEIRADSHAQLACSAPGKNVRITLS